LNLTEKHQDKTVKILGSRLLAVGLRFNFHLLYLIN